MLLRFAKNPILKPADTWWESNAVYNAAAVEFQNKILLLYRAQGPDWISRFGLAESLDGFHFKRLSNLPVVEPDINDPYARLGVEDPRITQIQDTYYITYTSASVYPATYANKFIPNRSLFKEGVPWRIRIGMLETADFVKYDKLGFLSLSVDAKDAVLLPEKINGNFALLYRILTNMVISYSPNLVNWTEPEF